MSEPVVFISHFKVKEGKLDDLRRLSEEVERSLREGEAAQTMPRPASASLVVDGGGTQGLVRPHGVADVARTSALCIGAAPERPPARVRAEAPHGRGGAAASDEAFGATRPRARRAGSGAAAGRRGTTGTSAHSAGGYDTLAEADPSAGQRQGVHHGPAAR